MKLNYTAEENTQILVGLLKKHGIKKVIVSPGSTNIAFVASIQQDSFFELYSVVDERSAGYMACGLSAECNEPVVISCTGATASRNYMPALTEAYYRKLPILAITSTQPKNRVGHNIPQVVDRSLEPKDVLKMSVYIPSITSEETEWSNIVNINNALLELRHNGGGPVHIDLETMYTPDFSVERLPEIRKIDRMNIGDRFPEIDYKKVAIFVGAHIKWSIELTEIVDSFCEKYNAVVLCDHTSNYWGKYRILPNILCIQRAFKAECINMDLLIHIGEMSGAYMQLNPKEVWRVHPDGEIKDTFKKITYIFQMEEYNFFKTYIRETDETKKCTSYFDVWYKECNNILAAMPELPFSNAWIASKSSTKLPVNSSIHFGILNSLRTWNYFELTKGTLGFCNTGGFGIDGCVSSLIGASLANKDKLFFGVVGDLAFFYDMNSIGNKHFGNNIRLIIVNNGKGNEFRNYGNWGFPLGEYADEYICAAGHFGNKSKTLIKNLSESLGFTYLSASTKEEYERHMDYFFSPKPQETALIFEVFTETELESNSLEIIYNLNKTASSVGKDMIKSLLGEKGVSTIKKFLK